jgi:hypothetical protein
MWNINTTVWTVIYEIHCRNPSLPGYYPFTIEIDGETFRAKVKTKRELGSINVYGTKRHWDFRLAAIGIETSEDTEESYANLIEAIESSLYIP